MSRELPAYYLAAILLGSPKPVILPGVVVQTKPLTTTAMAASASVTLTSGVTVGNSIFLWGTLNCSVAGSAVSISVSDDKSSPGWQIDAAADPGGGNTNKIFIASCIAPSSGVKTITVTATGGTITATGAALEMSSVTGKLTSSARGSNGNAQTSPMVLTNPALNTTPKALVLSAFAVVGWSPNQGTTATAGLGTYVPLASNQDSTGAASAGLAGYVLDSTATIDSISHAWASGNAPIAQVQASYSIT